MENKNKFKLVDADGKEIEYEILFTFESNQTKNDFSESRRKRVGFEPTQKPLSQSSLSLIFGDCLGSTNPGGWLSRFASSSQRPAQLSMGSLTVSSEHVL